jgi:small basic protein
MSNLSPDSIIMGKIADIVTSPSGGISDFISAITPKIPAIIAMIMLKKCLDNAGEFFSAICTGIKEMFKKMIYSSNYLTDAQNVNGLIIIGKILIRKGVLKIYFSNLLVIPIRIYEYFSYIRWLPQHKKLLKNEKKRYMNKIRIIS